MKTLFTLVLVNFLSISFQQTQFQIRQSQSQDQSDSSNKLKALIASKILIPPLLGSIQPSLDTNSPSIFSNNNKQANSIITGRTAQNDPALTDRLNRFQIFIDAINKQLANLALSNVQSSNRFQRLPTKRNSERHERSIRPRPYYRNARSATPHYRYVRLYHRSARSATPYYRYVRLYHRSARSATPYYRYAKYAKRDLTHDDQGGSDPNVFPALNKPTFVHPDQPNVHPGPNGLLGPIPNIDPAYINQFIIPQLSQIYNQQYRQIQAVPFVNTVKSVRIVPQEQIHQELVKIPTTELVPGCSPETYQYQYKGLSIEPTLKTIEKLIPTPFLYKLKTLQPEIQKYVMKVLQPEIVENLVSYYRLQATLKEIRGYELTPIEKKVIGMDVVPQTLTLKTLEPYIKSTLVHDFGYLPYNYQVKTLNPVVSTHPVPGVQIVPEILKQYGVKIKPFYYSVPASPALYANPFQSQYKK
ncbi:unnamed protein product [Gordionus sp. m RMFG-2023]